MPEWVLLRDALMNALQRLAMFDPDLARLPCADGEVVLSPRLQGRIFCEIGGELLHRLDADLLENPRPGEFNNLGGNSLWPAPEGGPFAFNYLPGSSRWTVQPAIADDPAPVVERGPDHAVLSKRLRLLNRRGVALDLQFERRVRVFGPAPGGRTGVRSVAYVTDDSFRPLGHYSPSEVLLSAWSLEQFPGGEGVTAFAKVARPEAAINFDFYGLPERPPVYQREGFTIPLGGREKFQLGVRAENRPALLGALDVKREMLVVRQTDVQDGRYFNIADNDQPRGPWSAADMYSVFNGGALGFFELETIGSMHVRGDWLDACRLTSRTTICTGPLPQLVELLEERHGVRWDVAAAAGAR